MKNKGAQYIIKVGIHISPDRAGFKEEKMEIADKIKEIVEKVTKDEDLKKEFAENPTKAIEKVAGVDLPDDVINGAVAGIKAKLVGDAVTGGDGDGDGGGIIGKIKDLF